MTNRSFSAHFKNNKIEIFYPRAHDNYMTERNLEFTSPEFIARLLFFFSGFFLLQLVATFWRLNILLETRPPGYGVTLHVKPTDWNTL